MASTRKFVDPEADRITPKPSAMRAIQNQTWTTHGAIAELVDNSWGAGRGNASHVTITWDHKTRLLTVVDNGVGMTGLKDLFKLGETAGRTPNDIGEYGSGGTMAVAYLASSVWIWTMRDGQVAHAELHWNDVFNAKEFPIVPTIWKRATARNTPAALLAYGHGTCITLKVLRTRRVAESQIRRDLSALFAPGVRRGKKLAWVTAGQDLIWLGDPMDGLTDISLIDLTLELTSAIGVRHLHVTGEIGRIEDLPIERSRIAVSYAHRVVKWTRDCFRHSSGRSYPGVGVCGWIQLDDSWQGLYSTTKDDIDDAEAFQSLMDAIFEHIEPLLQRLKDERDFLLLDEITLELQAMFMSGRRTPATYGDESPDGPVIAGGPNGLGAGDSDGDGRFSGARRLEGDRAGGTKDVISKLEIIHQTDKEMIGKLANAEVEIQLDDTTIVRAYVNKEHHVITVALEQHPVNRMALAVLIAQALAYKIIVHPKIVRAWFGPKQATYIETMPQDQQAPFIVRLLMDRFKYETRH
jgi:Histidine kinase-, DNA gyrase B-, and HSP90-like ATPase